MCSVAEQDDDDDENKKKVKFKDDRLPAALMTRDVRMGEGEVLVR